MARASYPEHVTKWMTSYLTGSLCPALKIPPVFDELALPTYGLKSYVLMVRPHDGKPFVLRCVTERGGAAALLRLSELAQSRGLPMPRVRYSDTSRGHFRKHGFGVVVEDMIEGEHLEAARVTAGQRAGLARNLARVHTVENGGWGPVESPGSRSYFDRVIVGKIENRLRNIARMDEDYEKKWREEILAFVKSRRKGWDGGPPFSLIHDKINTGNVVFSPGGEIYFLDIESLCYGMGAKDLTAALYYFCAGEKEEANFKEAYFAQMPARYREHYSKFEALYRVWHHVSRWATKSKDFHRLRERDKDDRSLFYESRAREREAVWRWLGRD